MSVHLQSALRHSRGMSGWTVGAIVLVAIVALFVGLVVASSRDSSPVGPTGATEAHCREWVDEQWDLYVAYGIEPAVSFEDCYYGPFSPEAQR